MNTVAQRIFKNILLFGLLVALLAAVLFGNYALSFSNPEWLRFVAREIQAACRDAGTQWMVVACLACYFITFLFLEKRILPQKGTEGTKAEHSPIQPLQGGSQESEKKEASPDRTGPLSTFPGRSASSLRPPSPQSGERNRGGVGVFFARLVHFCGQNSEVWLVAFVVLVLVRYAFDYSNAARSLQVVVLLTGIVIGKGIALWVGWARSRETNVLGRGPEQVGQTSPLPTVTDSSSEAVRGNSALNSQPSTLNRAQFVLCVLTLLLAGAALWHPARGMEFFYRGQQRWTGPWDNPNLFGLLMGVGVVLAVGLVASRIWRIGIWGGEKRLRPPLNSQPSPLNFCRRFPSLVTRHQPLVLLVLSAALCGYGLIKSYSRGAWLGTAVGLGFLVWKWVNRTHLTPALSPRPTGGEGASLPRHSSPESQLSTRNLQPATSLSLLSCSSGVSWLKRNWFLLSVFLISTFVICFWQFRHTESPLVRRVFSVGNINDFSWRNRVAAWEGAGRMMMDKPLRGFGWGQAEQVYSKEYRAARLEEAAAIQMNDYLMIGISAGVPALGCLLIYLWLALGRGPRVERREPARTTPHPGPLPERGGEGGVRRELAELATFNLQPATIASSGAMVLLIGFWFDGGMFKLPTAAVFWILLELARISPRPVRRGEGQGEGLGLLGAAPRPASNSQPSTLNFFTLALRWSAGIASVLAVALTAIHVITPQLAVSERTLALARQFLVPSRENDDFAYLAAQPIWSNAPLKTLLQHAHLAHYNRTLVNWKLEDQLYRDFVLSPEIVLPKLPAPGLATTLAPSDGERAGVRGIATPTNHPSTLSTLKVPLSTDLKWRRELWEYFYPRIRRESTMGAAAEIVLRGVREKIVMVEGDADVTILEMWQQGRTSATGRARLQVAAWRAVGIPARLNQSDRAEFWNGTSWVE